MRPIEFLLRGFIAIALSAFSLTFVTPASAACGWVLWWEDTTSFYSYRTADAKAPGAKYDPQEGHSWNILGAYPTYEACERQQEWKIGDMLKTWRKQKAEVKFGEHTITYEQGSNVISQRNEYVGENTSTFWESIRYLCLPDTVDPRRK
jgi:hypothetical protein